MTDYSLIISYLVTFLIGAFTGASGKYLADKYTDKRRTREKKLETNKLFKDTFSIMPKLIYEMKEDLSNPEYFLVRDFVVLPNKSCGYNPNEKHLCYYENSHIDLIHKIKILEDRGFIVNISQNALPKYRMTEEFVDFVSNIKAT